MAALLRWLARSEHELPPDPTWLTVAELERAGGMRFTKRRSEYLLRRWVAKQAVAAALGMRPDSLDELAHIEVANRLTGAPYIVVDGRSSEHSVSLSDRAGWAVCVVAPSATRVGCDLEIVEPRSRGFVQDFLTQAEQEFVEARADGDHRDAAANLVWSAKEAALKVLGTGLRRDTRSVEVTAWGSGPATDGWGRLTISTGEATSMQGWWRRAGVFLLTVAADQPVDPPAAFPGSTELAEAAPVHSWVRQPLAQGWVGPTSPAHR